MQSGLSVFVSCLTPVYACCNGFECKEVRPVLYRFNEADRERWSISDTAGGCIQGRYHV